MDIRHQKSDRDEQFLGYGESASKSRVDSNSVDRMCVVCIHSAGVAWMHLDRLSAEFYNGFNQKQIKYNLILVQFYSSRHQILSRCN